MKPSITLASNIACMRKEEKLTQDDLASFLGVTKASVSKWETGQSYPDMELLPRIATFFDVSIDELLGYQPQMSRAEIRATCEQLRKGFAEKPFDQAHEECQKIVRDYFACYPLLVQVAVLYLNHMELAGDNWQALSSEAIEICQRVRRNCTSSVHIRQAEGVEAACLLFNGDAQGAAELLADAAEPDAGTDILLARAYNALGRVEDAEVTLQAMLYQALVLSLNRLSEIALMCVTDHARLTLAHQRALALIDAFNLGEIFVNVGSCHFSFAMAYAMGGNADDAIKCLQDYERSCQALQFPIKMHGDGFFNKLDTWIDESIDIGPSAPRDETLIKQSMVSSIVQNPVFAPIADDPRFKRIVASLQEIAR